MVPKTKLRLGDMLVQEKRLTQEQLQQALARQKQTGRRLGAVLQDLGFVTDDVIAKLLSSQLARPYFEPALEMVDLKAARRLSELQGVTMATPGVAMNHSHVLTPPLTKRRRALWRALALPLAGATFATTARSLHRRGQDREVVSPQLQRRHGPRVHAS